MNRIGLFGMAAVVAGLMVACSPQTQGEGAAAIVHSPGAEEEKSGVGSRSDSAFSPGQHTVPQGSQKGGQGTGVAASAGDNAALQWLADHQNPLGYWSAKDYAKDSIRTCREKPAAVTHNVGFRADIHAMHGSADHDTGWIGMNAGVTGLALLAFVEDGNTLRDGPYKANVAQAVRYVLSIQDAEGCFGARDDELFVYNHAACTWALCRLHRKTMLPTIKGKAQKAVDFIVRCQNPGLGWRYGIQPKENDTSVTTWMVLALDAARSAGLVFDAESVYDGANAWYDKVSKVDENGIERVGYDRPGGGNARLSNTTRYLDSPGMDAGAMAGRILTGSRKTSERPLGSQAGVLMKHLPAWYTDDDESKGPWKIDMHYWFLGTVAMSRMGETYRKHWKAALAHPVLLRHQRGTHPKDVARFGDGIRQPAADPVTGEENPGAGRWLLDEHGSWDPVGPWGSVGGRVYATAINSLTLTMLNAGANG